MLSVVMDHQFIVKRLGITQYNALRGAEVQSSGFRNQFLGKGPTDPIRVGQDVDAVTGATISSRSVSDGVRQSIHFTKATFSKP